MHGKRIKPVADLRSLARSFTDLSISSLAGIIQNSANDNARVAAIGMMLDRGWGKPSGSAEEADRELRVVIRHIVRHETNERTSGLAKVIEHTPASDDA